MGIALKECYDEADYDVVEPYAEVRSKYGNWVNKQFSNISELEIGSYDLVIMNQVLEHVPDPLDFLGSVNRLLKPESYVYIDVPSKIICSNSEQNRIYCFGIRKACPYCLIKRCSKQSSAILLECYIPRPEGFFANNLLRLK